MMLPIAIHPNPQKKPNQIKVNHIKYFKPISITTLTYLISTEITVKWADTVSDIGIVTISTSKIVS